MELSATMYESHFGFSHAPFGLTPDTRFFFSQASHQEALNTLLVALRSGEGFLKVTGEIGLGKTQLCRQLLNSLGGEFVTAWVPNPAVTPRGLLQAVASELRCIDDPGGARTEQLMSAINARLLANAREGKRTLLVVDEAQALSDETLEAIRLLTNLETETYKLLQVVLFGQPELDARLKQDNLRQLRQRITFSHRLRPLTRAQFDAYVGHRLQIAGAQGPLFSAGALAALYAASRGTPRLVNILCHKSLLAAFGPGAREVGRDEALAAIQDTEGAAMPVAARAWAFVQENPGLIVASLSLSLVIAWGLTAGLAALIARAH